MSGVMFSQHGLVLVRSSEEERTFYSLAVASQLTGVDSAMLLHYCQTGLLGEARRAVGVESAFDDDAIYEVRRIEYFRQHHGVNLSALPLVCNLSREIERLHADLRMLRAR